MNNKDVLNIIKTALKEDNVTHDITTFSLISEKLKIPAKIILKEDAVICGMGIAERAFKLLDKDIKFKPLLKDGQKAGKGACIAKIKGNASAILRAERTALNFLGRMCGIATLTSEFVRRIKPYKVKIIDTRKTTPNLRLLEKYAVRCGGGFNHRFDLSGQALIKDNHLAILRCPILSFSNIVADVRRSAPGKKVEIEVNNLKQFKDALLAEPDIIMLDNFRPAQVKKAVKIRGKRTKPLIEASGGITLKNIKKIAACFPDMISIGALTHSAKSIDVSLEI
ncbi:MAG: nicotinate-nucleotide diphosphorylase (carboxylating) [Candidatus Omnitrophica bacterium CG11_big_fil_rev_8_21_14_0_20_42_13]|uniref:Probable nicotinate-nucleotide pyrophosphorylase [carboxylating] n=1 Tax=Candidatus Ghiorseimicrobium undicola TaxID=1974746 RepID=A0A2H0LZB0_9BACT|nr:MAG: nicotinate-nucleotide diphosphorylase (carboxylating) [Candidatus Omnitrophica bacterium CG11_big_fil_rev_8_21_14_0_20_42_13]